MKEKNEFVEQFKKEFDTLEMYTIAITRAHGKHHPEAFDVRKVFEQMTEKVNHFDDQQEAFDLTDEFKQLREITSNYEIPDDVCKTYETVYKKLEDFDQTYHNV